MSNPSSRKRQKKTDRQQRARAKVAARRKKWEKLREAATAGDPSRNLHADKGRAVVVNDITPYARQKCSKCAGRGIVGMRTADEQQGAEPCKCATQRFFKKHGKELIVDAHGRAWWPAKAEDYQVVNAESETVETRSTREPEPGEKDSP